MTAMNRITLSYVVLVSVACVLSTADSLKAGSGRMEENKVENQPAAASDLDTLLQLNLDYIQSVQTSDVQRFEQILSDDFRCSLPDGLLVDKARFLELTAQPVTISDLQAQDVEVRIMGDFAIIHARTVYTTSDGSPGSGRYTDVWARRDDRWLAVSAHVTRN
jgi:ketosteroid isomerase-like protein